ncbi:MAG: EAL domain-containing protein [Spongiibacteraceae bacterium]
MKAFHNLPIREKIQRIVTMSIAMAVVLIMVVLTVNQFFVVQADLNDRMTALSKIIGKQAAPAIIFQDSESASNDLALLGSLPYVVSASLYRSDHSLFVSYSRGATNDENIDQSMLLSQRLAYSSPIKVEDKQVGSIEILVDNTVLYQSLINQVIIVFVTSLIALVVALLIFGRLQRVLTDPLLDLSSTISQLTSDGNYSLRAKKYGDDEVGSMVDCFNNMLDVIEERDASLEKYRKDLAQLVDTRTDQLKVSESKLHRLAHYDPLTNLPNRNFLEDRFYYALEHARRDDKVVGVLFLDLDHFKNINDTFGHTVGDKLLQDVAKRILSCVRSSDTVCRLGGDEFIIVLESLHDENECLSVAQKIVESFQVPFDVSGKSIVVTCSVGISVYPKDGVDMVSLLRNSDSAMYRAKEQGRGRHLFYSQEFTLDAQERLTLEVEMHQALAKGEFELYFQPQVSLKTGLLVGAEALIRWNHPMLGRISPDKFIPIAESTGLIDSIGLWVIQSVCGKLVEWKQRKYPHIQVAVNVSGYQLTQGNLVDGLKQALEETNCDAADLELEVTEGYFIKNPDQAVQTLEQLKAIGVSLAVDDFGTGYSSLAYLKKMPIDKLKIDQSFIRDIPQDKNDEAIAKAIIALANSMQLEVIAEGVETEQQLAFLQQEGCDQVQGYLFSRPLPLEQMEGLLGDIVMLDGIFPHAINDS